MRDLHNFAVNPDESLSPPPDLLVTGHFKAQPGYRAYRPRGSPNWYVSLTLRGHGIFRQPEFELRTNPGDLVVLRPHAFHDYEVPPRGRWEFIWAHFNPRPHWLSWWQLPEVGAGRFVVTFRTREVLLRVRRSMLRLHADVCAPQGLPRDFVRRAPEPEPYREYLAGELDALQRDLALCALEEGAVAGCPREQDTAGGHTLDSRVQQVVDIISRDPSAKYDIDALARLVMLSPSRLAHIFKQETGDTIGQHIAQSKNAPSGAFARSDRSADRRRGAGAWL